MTGKGEMDSRYCGQSFFLLSPLSTKEWFSEDLCSLPSFDRGCARCRQSQKEPYIPGEDLGIQPQKDPVNYPVRVWAVFSKNSETHTCLKIHDVIEPNALEARYLGKHYAAFCFENRQALHQLPHAPVLARFRAWSEHTGRHQTIAHWYDTHDPESTIDLNDCFANDVFVPFSMEGLDAPFIMADMIRNYLHRHCRTFLNHPKGDRFGLQLCRIKRTPLDGPLHNCAISFSAVHPQSKEIQFWDEPHFGSLAIGTREKKVQTDLDRCHPLTCSDDALTKVTFADCFTENFRSHILPKELDQTYLDFSMGEIAAYLLHWILLRTFALPEENSAFLKAFRAMHEARTSEKPAPDSILDDLFKARVTLPPDPNLIKRGSGSSAKSRTLCIFNKPTPFHEVMASIELQHDQAGSHAVLLSAADFLLGEFSEDAATPKRGFANLPMYKDLGWSATKALATTVTTEEDHFRTPKSLRRILSEIIVSMTRKRFDLTKGPPDLNTLAADLERHSKLSVYPFKHILTHWPRGGPQISQYLILPLQESSIGERVRPVIFAHVFRATDRQKKLSDYATKLQQWLLPCGQLLAMKYDPERRENEIFQEKMITGGFLAHELNKLLHKHYAFIRQQLCQCPDPNAAKWVQAWDHVSATAHMAFLSAKSFLSPDSHSQLCRNFLSPLIALHRTDRLVPVVWEVAKAIYESNKLDQDSSNDYGPPIIEQLEEFQPQTEGVTEHEFASLFLLIGELLRNFCYHSFSPREGQKGQFKVDVSERHLTIALEDWRPSIPSSNTLKSMKNFLQYNGIGDIESEWLVTWKHFVTRISISLSTRETAFGKGES